MGYRKDYGLENISSLFRGTLRRKGFSKSWDKFVQLGMTDDSYQINNSEDLSIKEFLNLFLPKNDRFSVEENFCNYFSISSDSYLFTNHLTTFTNGCSLNTRPFRLIPKGLWTCAPWVSLL